MTNDFIENYEIIILAVDDNVKNIQLIGCVLQEAGYKIVVATDGKEALNILDDMSVHLILLDVMMPGMDGYEVCEIVKQDMRLKDIPVIFLTAKNEINDLVKGFKVGGVDYITKPFNKEEVLARVKTHIDLKISKDIIKQQAEELMNINANLEIKIDERTIEILNQKKEIELKSKEITDSIKYARKIQTAILPPGDYIKKLFPYRFILYLPKDIVSGDFYWLYKKDNKIITVVADCTGHGVPGAFMSMLGVAFLNEIINSSKELHPNEILNKLRIHIIESLHQTGRSGEAQDGMDIALHIIDEDNKTLEFAGANLSLYLIRNNELMIVNGDKMPIGIYYNAKDTFTNNIIQLKENDVLYTFSDGYHDQFGGNDNKKFQVKNFKELLLNIHRDDMEIQRNILYNNFLEWKGDIEQVDDVLVVGVKIR